MSPSEPAKDESTRIESPSDAEFVQRLMLDRGVERFGSGEVVKSIGRYRIERRLGQGGFGSVYLGLDEELNRRVAIKVPKRLSTAQLVEYREEAQKLAKLEHPGVVPIYDIGHTAEFPVFLVTKFVEGGTLTEWMQRERPKFLTIVRLIADVAEALHATHLKGIFHRDIKPANILVDAIGKPCLADFGLALKEGQGLDNAPEILGTPAYMSPEQAAGEGHRVDGQTDIFSLGVVLYEVLAGVQPFRASEKLGPRERHSQLLECVKTLEPRPPRQINDQVPRELERICLKAMAKRKSERYTTARDMAEDLRHFATVSETGESGAIHRQVPAVREMPLPSPSAEPSLAGSATPPLNSDREPLQIVPKGLRSFDGDDASFFLVLLPGARDRNGLPESLRFWKARIESLDHENHFAVGVLYGPSGCGKSSLVKAGLIPHLADHVVPIYLEASGDETELRLARAIRRACPEFGEELSLPLLLKSLRRGTGLPSGKKALIILDQFEQWLYAKRGQANLELSAALRQCDGERLQCLILVRDDFWLALSHFLEELEIPLLQGRNCAMADLFDPPHARKVLDAFGTAFGARPAARSSQSAAYDDFLDQAVAALSEEGKIVSVRLALFAEMVKAKPWTPQTLKAIGGAAGVGVAFLEETFSASNAPIAYRTHEQAVRAVLQAILPDSGTNIKGQMVSRSALLIASGYAARPRDFDSLLHILDRDLRLITPVDADAASGGPDGVNEIARTSLPPPSYQLAHDYLVPSIREWLNKKLRATWRGRAQLCLAERTAQWTRSRQRRYLPTLVEHLAIQAGVPRPLRQNDERRLLRAAKWYHGSLLLTGIFVVSLLSGIAWEVQGRTQARRLVQAIYAASPMELPGLIEQELPAYRRWADVSLRVGATDTRRERSAARWRASLALVPVDSTQVPFLYERLLECSFDEFAVIRNRLAPHRQQLDSDLWKSFRDDAQPDSLRFRAGLSLVDFSRRDVRDSAATAAFQPSDYEYLAQQLVAANPIYQRTLLTDLQPAAKELLDPLTAVCLDADAGEIERVNAASALAHFAAHDVERLAKVISRATAKQFQILFPVLTATPEAVAAAHSVLEILVTQQPQADWDETQRVELGRQRAGAAITLFRMQARTPAFETFRIAEDPESLTQFVARSKERGVRAEELLDALESVTATTSKVDEPDLRSSSHSRMSDSSPQMQTFTQFGLLLALGEFAFTDLPAKRREAFQTRLLDQFAQHPSSAIHGACGWLLRRWGFKKLVADVEQRVAVESLAKRNPVQEWFVLRVPTSASDKRGGPVTGTEDFFSFVVFQPGEFDQGSANTEKDRSNDERRHRVRLTRAFAILDREVTRQQFERFLDATGQPQLEIDQWSPFPNSPVINPTWFQAVSMCRWLTTQLGLSEAEQSYRESPGQLAAAAGNSVEWTVRLDRPGVRLPTEAEWEFACRAGTRTTFGFGSDRTQLVRHAVVLENSVGMTKLVGSARPNLRGLSDMHGNVFEWCNDVYDSNPQAVLPAVNDPISTTGSKYRVLRGGSWLNVARLARSAYREWNSPDVRSTGLGIRIVLPVPNDQAP